MIVGFILFLEEMKHKSTDEEKEPAKRSRIRAKLKISEARAQLQSVKTVTYHHTCKILNTYALLSSCDMIFVAPVLAITEATVVFCSTTFLQQIFSNLPGTDVSLWSSLIPSSGSGFSARKKTATMHTQHRFAALLQSTNKHFSHHYPPHNTQKKQIC